VEERVAHQGNVHLAGHRLVASACCPHLVDRVVRAVVFLEVEG